MAARVLLVTGTSGSGKTTVATLLAECVGWIRISEDDIWSERFGKNRGAFGSDEHRRKRRHVHDTVYAGIRTALDAGKNVGIEEGAKPGLITGRLYSFCRNPIFLALLLIIGGYTLLLPTRLSLVLLLGTYLGIRQQVAAEEAYLLRTYGESYREYARRIGRFLPGLGRLR